MWRDQHRPQILGVSSGRCPIFAGADTHKPEWQVGFNADHDHQVNESLRFVQLTPPGSACSIVMGTGITEMPPGSQRGVQVVVADVQAARQALIDHGVEASEIDVLPWGSFVTFADPDGNSWALQQLPARG
jgi:uncharacterized glyoxalase superfamily protein PhnB